VQHESLANAADMIMPLQDIIHFLVGNPVSNDTVLFISISNPHGSLARQQLSGFHACIRRLSTHWHIKAGISSACVQEGGHLVAKAGILGRFATYRTQHMRCVDHGVAHLLRLSCNRTRHTHQCPHQRFPNSSYRRHDFRFTTCRFDNMERHNLTLGVECLLHHFLSEPYEVFASMHCAAAANGNAWMLLAGYALSLFHNDDAGKPRGIVVNFFSPVRRYVAMDTVVRFPHLRIFSPPQLHGDVLGNEEFPYQAATEYIHHSLPVPSL
jgi:hypothetical protein